MSEKEKRICIFKENFDTNITEVEGPKYMTRTEAIERMANVFYDFCEGCKTYEEYERLAEAALDALVDK